MAKFHINNEGNVNPCNANVKDCQFGGGDGSNHYETVYEAQAEVQRRNTEQYGEVATHTKESRREERTEYAPRVVDNAVSEEDFENAEDSSDNSLKSYNELEQIGQNYQIESEKDQVASYTLAYILENGSDGGMMKENEIKGMLDEMGRSDVEADREAAADVRKVISKEKTRKERTEYAPRVVENALSQEQLSDLKPDSNNKEFKKYKETVKLYKNIEIKNKVDQEVSYMLEDIVGYGYDSNDMMSDEGINSQLYEWSNSDRKETRAAADKIYEMLINRTK